MGVVSRGQIGVGMDYDTVTENMGVDEQGVAAIEKCENTQQQHCNQFVVPMFHSVAKLTKTFYTAP